MKELRADRNGPHRVAFEKNKKILLKTQNTCGICGQPVDKSLRYPHPLSPVIDHIIPVNRNGHPSDIKNLQLAHWQSLISYMLNKILKKMQLLEIAICHNQPIG